MSGPFGHFSPPHSRRFQRVWRLGIPALLAVVAQTPPRPATAQEGAKDVEITSLADHPKIQEAFRIIEAQDARTQEELVFLTEIPAPPFLEAERARAFGEMLREAGADSVRLDEVGNVLAYRRGRAGARTVVLGAHLDTVFPEGTDVTVERRGDTLYAPGVGDDTRGLVVVLAVLRALADAGITTDANLVFLGSVGEEGLGDLKGVKHFFRDGGSRTDAFIEVDGGGMAGQVSMALGSVRYRVTYLGEGGHSWGAFGLANPAHALGRAIGHFSVAADAMTQTGLRTSFNVGRIGGGTSINSIPFEAWMEVDMRSESPESLGEIEKLLLRAVDLGLEEENEFRRDGPALRVEADRIGARPSGEVDPSTPLIQRALAAARYFGEEPYLSRSSTNSNIPISLGIPAVTIGRGGSGAENHSPDEWWVNEDGHKAIQRALLLLVAEAGYSG